MFAFILILASIFLLTYAIFLCSKMIKVFTRDIHKRAGRIMLSLIIIFLIGYIIYLVFNYNMLYSNFIIGIMFFFTTFFIMLVLHVNYSLIIRLTMKTLELKDFSDKLFKETQALTSAKERLEKIKSILEKKNEEMKISLQKWSAWRMSLVKKIAERDKTQQNAATEQKPRQKAEKADG